MRKKTYSLLLALLIITSGTYAQLGIKAGINLANEIKSLNSEDIAAGFRTDNLTGYQIGLVYQLTPKKSGIGAELGVLVSQKGYTFSDSLSLVDAVREGYKEMNYLEVPFNLRYQIKLGFIGVFGYGGVYAGYALSGKTVVETENSSEDIGFQDFVDRADYGYNLGVGVEFFRKIQFGVNWSQGLKNTNLNDSEEVDSTTNRVFSVGLTYLF
ncbi:MAG: PorT family protein [Bacteroidales bacterium]|nr:PorT family protein [Bacteroidales bacterium]